MRSLLAWPLSPWRRRQHQLAEQLPHAPTGESVAVTPASRQVIDQTNFDRSRFQLSTGSSGIPGNPRYDDCIDEYRTGQNRPLRYSRATVEAVATDTTVIVLVGQAE